MGRPGKCRGRRMSRHQAIPTYPPFFFPLAFERLSPALVHAGGSLAGKDSSDASATGSSTGAVLFCSLGILALRFAGMGSVPVLMSSALTSGVRATAVDVRRILHRFALRTTIAAAVRSEARTRRMLAFVRSSSSHLKPPADAFPLADYFVLLFDAPHAAPEPSREKKTGSIIRGVLFRTECPGLKGARSFE